MARLSNRRATRGSPDSRSRHVSGVTLALAFLGALSSTVLAYQPSYPAMITPPAALDYDTHALLVDAAMPAPTQPPSWMKLSDSADAELRRRREGGSSDESEGDGDDEKLQGDSEDTEFSSATKEPSKTSTDDREEPTRTSASVSDETTVSDEPTSTTASSTSPLPSAFDKRPSSAFRNDNGGDSCPRFVSNLLSSAEYQNCYPLSMMLLTSNGLFEAERQLASIVRVLDRTCAADVDVCDTFMQQAARNLTQAENCGAEFDASQYLVMQAYEGLRAYGTVFRATCLQDPDQDQYCFASAVTNTTEPSDTYFYIMPLGLTMPGGSNPSCGFCTKEIMGIYHSASADRSQLISETYENASQQVNTVCGPTFVENTLPEAVEAGARSLVPSLALVMTTLSTIAFLGVAF